MPQTNETEAPRVHLNVFVGCDSQGDACIYITRQTGEGEDADKAAEYLTEEELQDIAAQLEEELNPEEE